VDNETLFPYSVFSLKVYIPIKRSEPLKPACLGWNFAKAKLSRKTHKTCVHIHMNKRRIPHNIVPVKYNQRWDKFNVSRRSTFQLLADLPENTACTRRLNRMHEIRFEIDFAIKP
jgi:hypothetical protein